jgi:hypothetical protein
MAKRRKPADKASKLADDVLGFLNSHTQDQDADYVRRGRKLSSLDDGALLERWRDAFNARGDSPHDPDAASLSNDLESELNLRAISPPYDQVKAAFDKMIAAADKVVKNLEKDPDEYQEANEDLQERIDRFVASRDRPKN